MNALTTICELGRSSSRFYSGCGRSGADAAFDIILVKSLLRYAIATVAVIVSVEAEHKRCTTSTRGID